MPGRDGVWTARRTKKACVICLLLFVIHLLCAQCAASAAVRAYVHPCFLRTLRGAVRLQEAAQKAVEDAYKLLPPELCLPTSALQCRCAPFQASMCDVHPCASNTQLQLCVWRRV